MSNGEEQTPIAELVSSEDGCVGVKEGIYTVVGR